jgi:hypothetical protein
VDALTDRLDHARILPRGNRDVKLLWSQTPGTTRLTLDIERARRIAPKGQTVWPPTAEQGGETMRARIAMLLPALAAIAAALIGGSNGWGP